MEGASSTATLTIQRTAGTFTEVTVDWEVTTSSASSDISPISGRVTFSEGQTTGTFTVSALEDEVHNIISYMTKISSACKKKFDVFFTALQESYTCMSPI